MLHYRGFRNDDPPALLGVWNEAFTGRGAVPLRNCYALERFVFSKLYFDPAGLIIALEDNVPVGFAHAGFGPNEKETCLSNEAGVICVIGVQPSHRRRGIGSELLTRCETYLRGYGATKLFAGPMQPLNPFYFGLYGGSEMPGFLASDTAAGPFLEYHGYRPWDTCLVYQRRLDQKMNVADGRFPGLRRRFELQVMPRTTVGTWWQECVLGFMEPLEFRLVETSSGRVAGRAEVWEMEGFSWRWGLASAGIMNVQIREDLRRQGLGKFLLSQIMKYLQEQYFLLAEVQTMERNQPAVKLYQSLGFDKVDFGRVYQQDAAAAG